MRTRIALLAAAAVTVMTAVTAPPAWAAAPHNDTVGGATVITALPYSTTEDTTQATAGRGDALLNATCGAPATEASVWFKYTPSKDVGILIDVSNSSYDAGIIVASGKPDNLKLVDCGPRALGEQVTAGTTLYLLVFDAVPGEGHGGTMRMSVSLLPPPPELTISINPLARVGTRGRTVTVTGTATCSGADTFEIGVDLTQAVGRFAISGSGYAEFPCLATQHWSLTVTPYNGRFSGGKASALGYASACGEVLCSDVNATQAVQLHR